MCVCSKDENYTRVSTCLEPHACAGMKSMCTDMCMLRTEQKENWRVWLGREGQAFVPAETGCSIVLLWATLPFLFPYRA